MSREPQGNLGPKGSLDAEAVMKPSETLDPEVRRFKEALRNHEEI